MKTIDVPAWCINCKYMETSTRKAPCNICSNNNKFIPSEKALIDPVTTTSSYTRLK